MKIISKISLLFKILSSSSISVLFQSNSCSNVDNPWLQNIVVFSNFYDFCVHLSSFSKFCSSDSHMTHHSSRDLFCIPHCYGAGSLSLINLFNLSTPLYAMLTTLKLLTKFLILSEMPIMYGIVKNIYFLFVFELFILISITVS